MASTIPTPGVAVPNKPPDPKICTVSNSAIEHWISDRPFPNEVILSIIESCDIATVLKFRLVSKSTNGIINTFERQIARTVAVRTLPDYCAKIAAQSIMPEGIALLKRVKRVPVVESICANFVKLFEINHYYRPRVSDQAKKAFYDRFENGCTVAWHLSDAYAKSSLDNPHPDSHFTQQRRLYHEITNAQIAAVNSFSASDLTDYRAMYMLRSDWRFGWDGLHRFDIPWIHARVLPGRVFTAKDWDVEWWAGWCSVNKVGPDRMLKHLAAYANSFTSSISDQGRRQKPLTSQLLPAKASALVAMQEYHALPRAIRDMQIDSVDAVLAAIDIKIWQGNVKVDRTFGEAFKEMGIDDWQASHWRIPLIALKSLCLGDL